MPGIQWENRCNPFLSGAYDVMVKNHKVGRKRQRKNMSRSMDRKMLEVFQGISV